MRDDQEIYVVGTAAWIAESLPLAPSQTVGYRKGLEFRPTACYVANESVGRHAYALDVQR
jgi:hypothetical protein